jgi:hypothetical protein
MEGEKHSKFFVIVLVIIVVGVVLLIGGVYWYSQRGVVVPTVAPVRPAAPAVAPEITTPVTEETAVEEESLGAEIFKKASNPVSGEVPDAVTPVANPIEGAYDNPFQ